MSGSYAISVVFMNLFTLTALMMWVAEMLYLRNKNKQKLKAALENVNAI
jgi:hypothetical protein